MVFPPELIAVITSAASFLVSLALTEFKALTGVDLSANQAALATALANIVLAVLVAVLGHFSVSVQLVIVQLLAALVAIFFAQKLQAKKLALLAAAKKKK